MEARIKSDTLKPRFEQVSQKHLHLLSLSKTKPKSEWLSEARSFLFDLTSLLREINTKAPLGSEERLFLAEAKSKVMGYLSYWDRLLNKK
ncbi:hypothetical protein HZC30_07050 [Candidatus Woesearchaeota archaeon]|nr:hypothetical protein [Candidatus Woesearchaeota archaeon]